MTLKPGSSIWMPCEVKPGPFTNERLVRVAFSTGTWMGFVQVDYLREPIESGRTAVLAKVLDVENGHFRAAIPGHSFDTNSVWGEMDKVVAVGPV